MTKVHPIEAESYRILRSRVDLSELPPLSRAVTERIIHATADFDYIEHLHQLRDETAPCPRNSVCAHIQLGDFPRDEGVEGRGWKELGLGEGPSARRKVFAQSSKALSGYRWMVPFFSARRRKSAGADRPLSFSLRRFASPSFSSSSLSWPVERSARRMRESVMVSIAVVALRTWSSRSTAACCICKRKSRRL